MNTSPFPKNVFREYDVRGIADRDLSDLLAFTLGRAYVEFIKQKGINLGLPINIGRDCRLSGERLRQNLIAGISAQGGRVRDIGVCPTPLTYFSTYHFDSAGGIMITGSHNPSDYNGFKICVGNDTLHGSDIQELRVLMERLVNQVTPFSVSLPASLIETPIIDPYVNYVSKKFLGLKRKKVVLDAGNGTASTVAPKLFEKLGAEVIPLFCELDGTFPNHHPDPTVVANLASLIQKVKETGADFGVAFDGDSDRIGAVDEKGNVLYGDELMVLFSRDVLKKHPGATIISEVKSSYRLYDDISNHGGSPLMWKTGHSLIKAKMKETGAALAGEMSGHIFFADDYFGYDDAIYAAARLYKIVSESALPLSALLKDLPETVNTPEIRVDCEEELKFSLVREVTALLQNKGTVVSIDGIRVDFGDGWGLLRASNTQPVLVLRFESTSNKRLSEIQSVFHDALYSAARTVGHPQFSSDVISGQA